ncbi:hypothetical protein [Candidatus Odyssella thessalonicensis]|uniref:hypothetical protein n=1 Tax=Candidatus Odyssella thessalonicensis TaxID=84647 RepID=UPI000225B213|nr:hypothetical protein [Candidatus Odyssella thessalonicensis]
MRQKFLTLAILASLSINAVQATITKYDNPADTVEFIGTGVINLSESAGKQQAWQNEDYSQGERPAALEKKRRNQPHLKPSNG